MPAKRLVSFGSNSQRPHKSTVCFGLLNVRHAPTATNSAAPEADMARSGTAAFGLTPPVLRAHNAPSSKVARKPPANQTRDRLDHAASDARCARQPPRCSADGRPAPTTTRQMALRNAQTNRCGGHRSAHGLSADTPTAFSVHVGLAKGRMSQHRFFIVSPDDLCHQVKPIDQMKSKKHPEDPGQHGPE